MSSQRERQEKRERERSQRQHLQPTTVSSTNNNLLFGDPIRKSATDDETAKRIKSTLGDFDSVQLMLINDPKPLLGISTREITRIKGHKAKIEQILSEMKRTLPPITDLDDFDDNEGNQNPYLKAMNNTDGHDYGSNNNSYNEYQRSGGGMQMDRNNRDRDVNDGNSDKTLSDRTFDDQKSFNNSFSKQVNCKKRKLSKGDNENGAKGLKQRRSTSSSESTDSSSNSSSISSSSSESSDEEEVHKETDKESIKQEEISISRQETPKTGQTAQAPEIAVWDLETFMDKKITTTTTSTTVSTNSSYKTSAPNSYIDVIDRVAKGELGEGDVSDSSLSSTSQSSVSLSPPTPISTPTPTKKRRKSIQNNIKDEVIDNYKKSVDSSQNNWWEKTPEMMTPKNNSQQTHSQKSEKHSDYKAMDRVLSPQKRFKEEINVIDNSFPPKNLIVSIKLTLLKRIPGKTTYLDSSSSSNDGHMSPIVNNHNMDTKDNKNFINEDINNNHSSNNNKNNNNNIKINNKINNNNNDNSNNNFVKIKNENKLKSNKDFKTKDERKEKKESKESSKMSKNSVNNITKSKSSKGGQPLQDNDLRNGLDTSLWSSTPPIVRENNNTFATNNPISQTSVKQEVHSPTPPQLLPLMSNTSSPSLPIPPILTTAVANVTPPTSTRTTPEISPSVGQPDEFLLAAKRLKHAADKETDRTVQTCKYLEAVLYFILTGNAMEQKANEPDKVCVMYKETLNLIRTITNKFSKSRSQHSADVPTTDHKLTTLSYRCQSLLYLKLSRIKSKEIRDNNKILQNTSQEMIATTSDNMVTISSTLWNAFQKQLFLLQQYHMAHDLWSQADHLIEKYGSCKAFFVALDSECGSLSLNSSFDHLVHYVRSGLQILK